MKMSCEMPSVFEEFSLFDAVSLDTPAASPLCQAGSDDENLFPGLTPFGNDCLVGSTPEEVPSCPLKREGTTEPVTAPKKRTIIRMQMNKSQEQELIGYLSKKYPNGNGDKEPLQADLDSIVKHLTNNNEGTVKEVEQIISDAESETVSVGDGEFKWVTTEELRNHSVTSGESHNTQAESVRQINRNRRSRKLFKEACRKFSESESFYNSDDDISTTGKNGKALSRSAIAARESRQKKKKYLQDLEESAQLLAQENERIKANFEKMQTKVKSLTTEVKYLRSVLANQSTIAALLKNIGQTPGVKFQSSENAFVDVMDEEVADQEGVSPNVQNLQSRKSIGDIPYNTQHKAPAVPLSQKRKLGTTDHDYAVDLPKSKQARSCPVEGTDLSGVCLHVSGSVVSLEFCAHCSEKASTALGQK